MVSREVSMAANLVEDTSLDDRVKPIIALAHQRLPSEDALHEATKLENEPSPAMLEGTARWIEIAGELARAGLLPEQILRVALRACTRAYGTHGPGTAMLARLFEQVPGVDTARALCEVLIEKEGDPPHALHAAANVALARLSAASAFEARFERLFAFLPAGNAGVRAILEPLPLDRREALLVARSLPNNPRHACFIADKLLAVRDLVDTEAIRAAIARALEAGRSDNQVGQLQREFAAGRPRTIHARPTPEAISALNYWLEKREAKRRADALGSVAERVWAERAISVEAPELASVEAWRAASDTRQREIAERVARAAGEGFAVVGLERFGEYPIAVLACETVRLSLVPGGVVEIGFSAEEEAAVRAASERNEGCGNHYELYEFLFEQLPSMRPLVRVVVGPLLASQGPGRVFTPPQTTEELERSRFRLPSEAEWEYLARGGRAHELTYRGTEVPDNEGWYEATLDLGPKGANAFGLWGFGYEPEACTDVFSSNHEGLPTDGSPRRGDGPRIVRGGAAQLYPWQATGEWQLLLSALRGAQSTWEFALAIRPVLGIRV
jgi:hypothetical protein